MKGRKREREIEGNILGEKKKKKRMMGEKLKM